MQHRLAALPGRLGARALALRKAFGERLALERREMRVVHRRVSSSGVVVRRAACAEPALDVRPSGTA